MRQRKGQGKPGVHTTSGATFEVVPIVGARRLFTHRMGDALSSDFVKGAIIRVIPSADASGADRAQLAEHLTGWGAARVWFAPAAAGRAVVVAGAPAVVPAPELAARAIIEEMVEQARTDDRERLRHVVDAALSSEGL